MPAPIATTVNTTRLGIDTANCDVEPRQRVRDRRREDDADRKAEPGADQRGDDALVAHHPPCLPPRHADGAQHPELRVRS